MAELAVGDHLLRTLLGDRVDAGVHADRRPRGVGAVVVGHVEESGAALRGDRSGGETQGRGGEGQARHEGGQGATGVRR